MATIDLIVLGILKKEPMGAYDIQKLVEYRNISKWVKISTPSIYKKAIQLEEKGFIKGEIVKEGKMPEKAVYSLTDEGEKEFVKLMMETASKPIHFFLDFNAVIVNLDKLPPESQQSCIASIEENIEILKTYLEENLREKENDPEIPKTGMAVLQQQIVLADAIEKWIISLKKDFLYSILFGTWTGRSIALIIPASFWGSWFDILWNGTAFSGRKRSAAADFIP